MAETIDEITIDYSEGDQLIVKQLDKEVLTRGAWTTIVFKYQQWEDKKGDYSPIRYTIRRYRKRDGSYSQQSKFNISNKEQAQKVIEVLQKWTSDSDK